MTDPRRLREEDPDSLEATLLSALRSEQPGEAARERVVRNLLAAGAGVGVSLIAAKAGAKASGLAWSSGWTIAGVSAGTALVLGTVTVAVWPEQTSTSPRRVTTPAAPLRRAIEPPEPAPTTAVPAPEPAEAAPERPPAPALTPARAVKRTPVRAERPAPAAEGLSRELAALSSVKRLLDNGAGALALEQLTAYEHDFPAGYLREEALLLRAQALLDTGAPERARSIARSVIERSPRGPLVEKARALVERAEKVIKP